MNLSKGDPLEIYTTNDSIMLTKYRKDTKEEFAKKWLAKNDHYANFYQARFTIERITVTCEVVKDGQHEYGVAICHPRDTFDASVGMAIALCRATNTPVPVALTE